MSDPDKIELGSTEIPDVIRTLAGVLHTFEGPDLEAQLQTYDIFLETLSPSVRPEVANLIRSAAAKAASPEARARIEAAATSVANGGRAAEPYNHAKAMEEYQKSFRASYSQHQDPLPVDQHVVHPPASLEESLHPTFPASMPRGKAALSLLLIQLDQIKTELKKIGRWSDNTTDFQAAIDRGDIKSYLDAPTFELWLQCVFLPRARKASQDDTLPSGSQVGEMARRQYDYMSVDLEAENLLRLLQHFDDLIMLANDRSA